MASGDVPVDSVPKPLMKSRLMAAIITAVVVIVACIIVLAVTLSPAVSPLASVHDTDEDRYPDSIDAFPDDPDEWVDSDDDGVGDNSDAFPRDENETVDSDGDGVGDNSDDLPDDPTEWIDSDEDGVGDNSDAFPNNPDEWSDPDGDGIGDNYDELPEDPTEWYDTDGDGVGDNADAFPADSEKDTPSIVLSVQQADEMILGISVEWTDKSVPWDSVIVILSDGYYDATWQLNSDGLEEIMAIWDFGSAYLRYMNVFLSVIELLGDGRLGPSDAFLFASVYSDFSPYVEYTMTLIYEPTMKEMANVSSDSGTTVTPAATMNYVAYSTGYKFTISTFPVPVNWSDVAIMLYDGIFPSLWFPSSDALNDGVPTIQSFDPAYIITCNVFLNVTDIAGNGEINVGDYFTLTTGDGTWDPWTEYTVSLIYLPNGGTICEMTFAG